MRLMPHLGEFLLHRGRFHHQRTDGQSLLLAVPDARLVPERLALLARPADEVNRRAQPEQGQPAKSLTAGDIAILEIDGEQLTVEITDIEDDPTYLGEEGELRELQITYRIADGHSRSGELGVTTLVEDEKVLIDA